MEPVQGGVAASRRQWTLLLLPGSITLALLFLVPLGMLVVFSFGTTDIVGRPQLGSTLDNYRLVFQDYNAAVVLRTVEYSVAATACCLVLGYAVAYTAARFAGRWGGAIIVLVTVPWLVDYLVRIYAWKQLLSDGGLLNQTLDRLGAGPVSMTGTSFAVVAGLVYGYLPLMVLPLYASLKDLDPSVIDAGKDLFGSPRQTFFHVTLPATRPGVVGGCLLVFLPVLGDFATAQFLGGPSNTMIGNIISDQFVASGSQTFGSALAVTLIVLLVLCVALTAVVQRGRGRVTEVLP
ncbi:ABC transporter permease [Nocardioides taihuensis]|uniref:ABC transporter permease n=1 Tax=Nocardioides taihuensis TaxID=1835606 RepID=A0ABW0BQP9_9ACTN